MPVRTLKKSYKNVTGLFYSRKVGRLVQFDSMLERDFILLMDIHPAVRSFAEQPMRLKWADEDGFSQTYVPDFLVEFGGQEFLGRRIWRPWIVELKYRRDLKVNWRLIRPRVRAGFAESSRRGSAFHLITEDFTRSVPTLNAKFLRPFLNCEEDRLSQASLCETLRLLPICTPKSLIATITSNTNDAATYMQALWTLIAQGVVGTNLEQPITELSSIWLASR